VGTSRGTQGPRLGSWRMEKAYSDPSEVDASEGEVIVDGPDGVAFSFTPDAAAETSDRLRTGAAEARDQKSRKDRQ
jgi:hypothetical protein